MSDTEIRHCGHYDSDYHDDLCCRCGVVTIFGDPTSCPGAGSPDHNGLVGPILSTGDQVDVTFRATYGFPSREEPGSHFVWVTNGDYTRECLGPIPEDQLRRVSAAPGPAGSPPIP